VRTVPQFNRAVSCSGPKSESIKNIAAGAPSIIYTAPACQSAKLHARYMRNRSSALLKVQEDVLVYLSHASQKTPLRHWQEAGLVVGTRAGSTDIDDVVLATCLRSARPLCAPF
jgi:hypothetical protein